MGTMKEFKIDILESETLKKILESNTLKNEVYFVLKQVEKESGCKHSSPIPIAKKYNLPYYSDLALLITLILDNERVL